MQVDFGSAARDIALIPVVADRRARIALSIVAFVVATSLGAHVAVPLPWTPVPMTLQPLFVILAGAVLGPRLGAAAMATYLAVGMGGRTGFFTRTRGHRLAAWADRRIPDILSGGGLREWTSGRSGFIGCTSPLWSVECRHADHLHGRDTPGVTPTVPARCRPAL